MATAEVSKFLDILSATISQHHLLGFGIPLPPLALFVVMLSKAHLTSHSRMSSTGGCDGAQVWPRGATPRLRSGVVAGRSYPSSEVRGSGKEELRHFLGQGQQREELSPPTPHPQRQGAVAGRS